MFKNFAIYTFYPKQIFRISISTYILPLDIKILLIDKIQKHSINSNLLLIDITDCLIYLHFSIFVANFTKKFKMKPKNLYTI